MRTDIVFLHAAGTQPDSWTEVIRHLPAHVTPWLPNLGPGTFNDHRALVESYLDRNELRSVILVGHGMGALVAAAVAADQPRRVTRLVLSQPQLHFDTGEIKARIRAFKVLPKFLLKRAGFDKQAAIEGLEQAREIDLRDDVAAITAPTLVLAAVQEQAALSAAEETAERIDGATLHRVEDVSGNWYATDGARFVAEIAGVLEA